MWVFLLLAMESIRTYRTNPHFIISTYHIPTWTTPLFMCLVVAALIPGTSLLGHLCGVGAGYIGRPHPIPNLLHVKPNANKLSSWPRLRQVPRSSRVGAPLDRIAPQPPRHPPPLHQRRPEDVRTIRSAPDEQSTWEQCGDGACWDYTAPRALNHQTLIQRLSRKTSILYHTLGISLQECCCVYTGYTAFKRNWGSFCMVYSRRLAFVLP